jgi:hypothetical protein
MSWVIEETDDCGVHWRRAEHDVFQGSPIAMQVEYVVARCR